VLLISGTTFKQLKFQASVMLLGVPLYIMKNRVKYPLEVIINI